MLVGLRWSTFEVWMDCMDCVLRGAQLYRPADEVEVRGSMDGRGEGSRSASPPAPFSVEDKDVPEGLTGPQVEGWHPQFSNLLASIDGRVVAGVPRKNKYREPKKIPHVVPLFEPGTPLWSSCEYSSTPSIPSPEVEVRRMAKTKSTPCIRSPDEWLAEGTQGNPCSAPPQSNPKAEVASTSSSVSSRMGSSDSSSRHSSRSSSSKRASTCSSSSEASLGLGKSVFKRKGRMPVVTEIMAEGAEFPGAPTRSDLQDGWGDVLDWNEGKPIRKPFGEPTTDERRTTRYFQFYIREDDKPRPIPKFMGQAIESVKAPQKRRSKSNQARARLTVFETGDTTPEQVAADIEHRREEERQQLITQQAKKAPSLVSRGKRPAVSLPVRKKLRTEEQPGKAVASAPSQVGEARAERLAPHRSGSRSSGERTLARQEHLTPSKTTGLETPAASGASLLASRPSANFIEADSAFRLSLVQDIVKSWNLATPGASDPPKVSEEEIAMAKVFARGVKAVTECWQLEGLLSCYQRCCERLQADLEAYEADKKGLQRQLEKAVADAQGRSDTLGYLYKVVLTLASEFQDDHYFEAYLHFVDERERAAAKGRDLDEVDFIPPLTEGEVVEDEATNPLEAKAGASEGEEHEDGGEPDV
ncbi:hypothetical protein Cgig2_002292 [Carnegiea gigantea]|uniref:Uncharacterized protein n=1 Tax=Carnegiea gigantea TaxID=171969 RepID=A0A9Q1KTE0_9CARY|nr:hypothetical protein Cgig2_002292 [Carnegiea gigantea]